MSIWSTFWIFVGNALIFDFLRLFCYIFQSKFNFNDQIQAKTLGIKGLFWLTFSLLLVSRCRMNDRKICS